MGQKIATCREAIRELGSVLVAFSGGDDSEFLLRLSADVLGRENVLAVIVISSVLPRTTLGPARRRSREMGIELVEIPVPGLTDLRLARSPVERFNCKKMVFDKLRNIADDRGIAVVVSGVHVEDVNDPRFFSIEEAKRLGLRRPLMEANMTKADVLAALKLIAQEA